MLEQEGVVIIGRIKVRVVGEWWGWEGECCLCGRVCEESEGGVLGELVRVCRSDHIWPNWWWIERDASVGR